MPELTDKLCRELQANPPAKSAQITYDDRLSGFGLRVTPKGVAAFILTYRVNRRQSRFTIGRFPSPYKVVRARKEAEHFARKVARGEDPQAEKAASRTAPILDDALDRYEAEHMTDLAPQTQRVYLGYIALLRKAMGRRKVAEIRQPDGYRFHQAMKAQPVRANRALDFLQSIFVLCIQWEWCEHNPCRGVKRFREYPRRRYYNEVELKAIGRALDEESNVDAANALRLIGLSGSRKGEVLSLRFEDIDADGIWHRIPALTKDRRPHSIPLSRAALEIIAVQRTRHGDTGYVFLGPDGAPLADLKHTWHRVCKRAGLQDARIHDLRHSFASLLVSRGATLPLIGALLGHSTPAVTQRYAHLHHDPLREGAEKVAEILSR